MKTLIVFLLLTYTTKQTIVERLNIAEREFKYCNEENKLDNWTIVCASNYIIKFEEAKLIDNNSRTYMLTGKVLETSQNTPLNEMFIDYGESRTLTCHLKEIGKTDLNGIFRVSMALGKEKIIAFRQTGFKTTIIDLNIE